jgi:putative hydrolase of the HAD superfamily
MPAIKNIIFDFGNVLFDIDMPSIERSFCILMGDQFENAWETLRNSRVLELYETGGMSTEEFVNTLCQLRVPALAPEEVVAAWNSIFIQLPIHRLTFMLELRQRYKVFLLSNINGLHEGWIADYAMREFGFSDYESRYFDGVYFSHLIRLRKPDPAIYEYVLADAEIRPEETLFFDDLPENIAAARQTGIQGVLHPPGTEIVEHVNKVLASYGQR